MWFNLILIEILLTRVSLCFASSKMFSVFSFSRPSSVGCVYLVRSVRLSMDTVDKTGLMSPSNIIVPTAPMEPIVPRGIVYTYTHASASIFHHLYPRIYPHMCACIIYLHRNTHTRTRMHAYMNTHVYTKTSKDTYSHTYKRSHTRNILQHVPLLVQSYRIPILLRLVNWNHKTRNLLMRC